MTKSKLKLLIKEHLSEFDITAGFKKIEPDLTIVSIATSDTVENLRLYVMQLHKVLLDEFDEDVSFEEKLKSFILSNNQKKIETTFKIADIRSEDDLKIVNETLEDIQTHLQNWLKEKKLNVTFTFKIK